MPSKESYDERSESQAMLMKLRSYKKKACPEERRERSSMWRRRGFTAIEMIVVLGVVAILLAALVPVISQYLPGVQLSGSTRTLAASLREAQGKAVTEQNQYLIRFVQLENPPIYQMITITIDPETQLPVEEQIREEQLPNNIALTLDPVVSQIVFSPDGGPSSPLNITLANNSSQKKIDISPAGFIKIE